MTDYKERAHTLQFGESEEVVFVGAEIISLTGRLFDFLLVCPSVQVCTHAHHALKLSFISDVFICRGSACAAAKHGLWVVHIVPKTST